MKRTMLLFPQARCLWSGCPCPAALPRALAVALLEALLLTLTLPSPVRAAEVPLTLAEAQRLATLRSQQIEASNLAVSASRDMALTAAERPDPVAKIGVENVPVNGADRFSLQRDFMTMRSVGIMQEITRPTKLRARVAASEQAVQLAEAQKAQAEVVVQRESALAWLERYYAEATERTILEQVDVARLDVSAAQAAYRGGRGTAADVLAARGAVAGLEDEAAETARAVGSARIALTRWVGDAADRPLAGHPAIDTIPLHQHALEAELADHPEMLALKRREELARAAVEVARAERHPDWSVELMYSDRGIGFSNMVTLELSVPLEIRRANRQDQTLAAKLAEASAARAEREDALREHAAEMSTMIDAWNSARERRDRYRTTIVPLAADRVAATRAGYRGGKATLTDLLLAEGAEIDARLKALQLEATAARLWAQLSFLAPTTEPALARAATLTGTRAGELP